MRDPERIDKVLSIIKEVWSKAPDLRFTQLIGSIYGPRLDPYRIEDEQFIKDLLWHYDIKIDTNKNSRVGKSIQKASKKKS